MKRNKIIGLIVVLILIVGVIGYLNLKASTENSYDSETDTNEGSSEDLLGVSGESMYVEFGRSEYERALSENKIILLYFYASWCPICRAEQSELIDAFNELNNENVIGFRVNYKDSTTDSYEENLAEEFGITYQHTKVIIKDGEQVLKSLESWNKEKYLEELNNLI